MSAPIIEGYNSVNITSTAAITTKPCIMGGFTVNSTNAGTIVFRDGGASGTAISGTITPAAGLFHRFPAQIGTSLHAIIAGTALDVTIFYYPIGASS